jgi:amino acid transporter
VFGPLFFLLPVIVASALFLVLLVVVIFLVRQADPDLHGRRPYTIYLFSVIFLTLFTVVVSLGLIGVAAAQAITDTGGFGGGSYGCVTTLRSFSSSPIVEQPQRPPQPPPPPPPPRFTIPPIPPPPVPTFSFEPFPTGAPEPFKPDVPCDEAPSGTTAPLAIQAALFAVAAGALLYTHVEEAKKLLAKEAEND